MFQTLKKLPAHVLGIEGEVLGVLFFAVCGLVVLLVPFLDVGASRGRPRRWLNVLAALAVITTVVPGTVWSELAIDRSAVLLHVFDVDDQAAFVARYKARYERPLIEIFQ